MSGTISTTITTAVTLSVDPTTINATGAVDVGGAYYAVQGPSPTPWILVNHGTVSSTDGGGVALNAGGEVRNARNASITAGQDGIVITGAAGIVSNSGTIAGDNGFGIYLRAGGQISNAAGGRIIGLDAGVALIAYGTVSNAGTIRAVRNEGIYLQYGGVVSNEAGGFIHGSYHGVIASSGFVSVDNAGTISSSSPSSFGVEGQSSGYVVNRAGGSITGGLDGIRMYGAAGATVVNAGVVAGSSSFNMGIVLTAGGSVTNQTGGSITGNNGGIEFGGAGTVVNAGEISDIASTFGGGFGIELGSGGSVTNQAGGAVNAALAGVAFFASNANTVVNAGTIEGGEDGILFMQSGGNVTNLLGGVVNGGTVGITEGSYSQYFAPLTIVNAGTIGSTGGDAVAFAPGVSNLLVVDPGAVFNGVVSGGNTLGSSVGSTLELASTASAGTVSGIGSQFIDFADIIVDPGANWQIAGSNSIVAGQTLANSGTIDITGTLVLSGGSIAGGIFDIAAHATLSGFGTVTSSLTNDGLVEAAGGTLDLAGPVDLASTGTLTADADLLELTGTGNVIAGILDQIGTGQIAFAGSSTSTIERGVGGDIARIDLFDNASLALGTGLSGGKYGGTFDDTSTGTTTFDPGADNFTLSGADTFVGNSGQALITGSATLTLSGHTHLANATLGGTEALHNSGSLTETGQMTIGDASTSAATVSNAGTWDIANNSGIGHGAATTSSFTNSGIFAKTAGTGTSVISANFVNDGTIIADAGTLDFTGGFTNNGTIIQNGGTVIFGPTASPSLFNQYASGIDSSGANDALASPPPAPPQPTLATPHPA